MNFKTINDNWNDPKAKFYTNLILALASNPNVYDPKTDSNRITEFFGMIGAGIKMSESETILLTHKLNQGGFAEEQLLSCADKIIRKLEE